MIYLSVDLCITSGGIRRNIWISFIVCNQVPIGTYFGCRLFLYCISEIWCPTFWFIYLSQQTSNIWGSAFSFVVKCEISGGLLSIATLIVFSVFIWQSVQLLKLFTERYFFAKFAYFTWTIIILCLWDCFYFVIRWWSNILQKSRRFRFKFGSIVNLFEWFTVFHYLEVLR